MNANLTQPAKRFSRFVGDIFGAPLAIEAIVAFILFIIIAR